MSAQNVITTPPLEPTDTIPGTIPRQSGPAKDQDRRSIKDSARLGNLITTLILSLGAVVMIAPLAWTFSTSLKTKDGVFELPPQWIPDPFVWENYART
jgi:multiple sugar transport system permease protein